MKEMNRILSLVLCLAMLVGMLPMFALNADAAETLIDAAIFCSDVHGSSTVVPAVFAQIADAGITPSAAGFVGDTNDKSSSQSASDVTEQAQTEFPKITCVYAFGSHDDEGGAGVEDVTGVLYNGDNFAIYSISQTDMESYSNAQAAAADFASDLEVVDESKPLFVISHMPLHARRSDNDGAGIWCDAINAVAASRDIVFFWGHNHTSESSTDTAAYYLAKTETITVEDDSSDNGNSSKTSEKTLAFTYMNAGYIGKSAGRGGLATTVLIYGDELVFQDYNSSGAYSGSYTHTGKTVTRTANTGSTEPTVNTVTSKTTYVDENGDIQTNGNDIAATGLGLTGVSALWNDEAVANSGLRDCVAYDVALEGYIEGETVTLTFNLNDMTAADLVVYADGVKVEPTVVENDGYISVTVTTAAAKGTYTIGYPAAAEDAVLTGIVITSDPSTTVYTILEDESFDSKRYLDITGLVVTATYDNGQQVPVEWNRFGEIEDGYELTFDMSQIGTQDVVVTYGEQTDTFSITIYENDYTDTDVAAYVADVLEEGYVARDIELTGYTDGTDIRVVMTAPADANVVYHVDEDGNLTKIEGAVFNNGVVVFDTDHFSTYVVGAAATAGTEVEVPGSSVTTTKDKVVYVLTDTIAAGDEVLIVSANSSSGYILGSDTGADNTVTILSGNLTVGDTTSAYTYIENYGSGLVWTVGEGLTFTSGNYKLGVTKTSYGSYYTSYGLTTSASASNASYNWTYSNYTLKDSTNSRYAYYYRGYSNNNSSWTQSEDSQNVYLYKKVTATETTTTGTQTATYGIEILVNNTAASTMNANNVVNGDTVQLGTAFTSTVEGQAPSGGTYTWTTTTSNGVASVDANGLVTFSGKAGTEIVKVSYTWTVDGTSYTVSNTLVITATAKSYTMDMEETATVKIGANLTLTLETKDSEGNTVTAENVTWTSSDDTVATVSDGVVSGLKAGDTTITAEWTDPAGVKHTDTVVVTVVDAVYTVTIDQGETYIHKGVQNGQTLKLTATVTRDEQTVENPSLTWSILSGGNLASIDASTGTLTFNGKEGEMEVKVEYKVNETTTRVDYITIHVHKSTAITPEESTTDFPRWPNPGAVRFDKTAQAVGDFSNTGVAQMELSMAGIPAGGSEPFDVVLVLDLSNSMEQSSRTTYLIAAAKAFMETICLNEDGTWNELEHGVSIISYNIDPEVEFPANTTSVYTDDMKDISSIDDYNDAIDAIEALSKAGGTDYAEALKHGYEVLNATKDPARKQYLIFMSDGAPTSYAYLASSQVITSSKHTESTIATGVYTENGVTYNAYLVDQGTSTGSSYELSTSTLIDYDEYYSYLMKQNGVEVYSVGLAISSTTGKQVLSHISSAADTETDSADNSHAFFVSDGDSSKLTAAFTQMGTEMMAAATGIEVADKITDEYEMIFKWPEAVQSGDRVSNQEFYIEVVNYDLDSTTHERNGSYDVLTRIYLTENTDGTLAISKLVKIEGVTSTATGTTTNLSQTPVYAEVGEGEKGYFNLVDGKYVYVADGTGTLKMTEGATVTGTADTVELHTPYFSYKASDKIITWHVSQTAENAEIALRYFLYLTNSLESAAGDIKETLADGTPNPDYVKPGTYETNEYATLEYTNFKGNECMQYFPKPQLTWNGAQVSYVFYLVNSAGQPVNTAGRVVTFAEAVFVTKIYTEAVVWNEEEGTTSLDATRVAETLLPSDYKLYDDTTKYEIHVYQNENGDDIYNYFVITAGGGTTIVYNTKAGIKYSNPGTYTKDNVDNNFDFANTTVAFAVVWERKLVEDTVVIDFGLPVDINVTTNDFVYNSITAIGTNTPTNVDINDGLYTESALSTKVDESTHMSAVLSIGEHTAQVINENVIRFTPGSMEFDKAIQFNYETKTDYYEDSSVKEGYLYSTVTVIPATTIYYEDDYVILTTSVKDTADSDGDGNTEEYITSSGWSTAGITASATQTQDRPGAAQITPDLDADNNYGYDAAYKSMSQYSMGSAAMVNVTAGKYATATFDFWGTGFDIISLTSATTGNITINVYADGQYDPANPNPEKAYVSETVNTYYGYKKVVAEDGTVTWQATASDDSNALYQVPVMKIGDGKTTAALPYGKYTAVITVTYIPFLDQNKTDTGYNFYLDAIRIYNPTGNQDKTSTDAYIKDGEAYPAYFEVRDQIIAKSTFDNLNDETISGIVFIDGGIAAPTIADYTSYGPNNETYLANGQAIAFDLNGTYTVPADMNLAKIQLAVKTVGGTGKVEVYGVKTDGTKVSCLNETISTATDMYYDITALEGMTVVIKSTGDAVISITNVKVTYEPDATAAVATASVEETEAPMLFSIRRSTADAAVMSLSAVEEEVPETTVPEETEPETTVPEETEPETTVPEETEPETTVPEETEPETTVPEETEPSVEEQVEEVVRKVTKIIKSIFGWLFG